jgi:hypothetical protein
MGPFFLFFIQLTSKGFRINDEFGLIDLFNYFLETMEIPYKVKK